MLSADVLAAMLVLAVAAGWIGWRRGTRLIHRRSLFEPDPPLGMSRRAYDRAVRRRHKVLRLVATLLYAGAGAAVGFLFLSMLARR